MILQDALPGIKRFVKAAVLKEWDQGLMLSVMTAFVTHIGRMSASQAAGAIRTRSRHRGTVTRFLARLNWSDDWSVLRQFADLLLQGEDRRGGIWIFIVDQTLCGHQGDKTQNTFSTGNRKRRPRKGRRYSKYKYARKRCHCFVMGLLLTPSGLRLPCFRSYYTEEYCKKNKITYRRQTELAAELIETVSVPEGAEVVVVGDTAFDAKTIRAACAQRHFTWIVPMNAERVLAGRQGKRPQVRTLVKGLKTEQFGEIRFTPGKGSFVAQRRIARCRLGPKAKTRTFYVHEEKRAVHSVGEVRLVFSTKKKSKEGQPPLVQKILMTNSQRPLAEVVELYDLRWQIELFFKELKSTLGLHQYRFRDFAKVGAWVAIALATFMYLEWYRCQQLRRRALSEKQKDWWRWQRTYGLCSAARQDAEEKELLRLADYTATRSGLRKLKKHLRAAIPLEYRKAA
jgi:hypothetical protein